MKFCQVCRNKTDKQARGSYHRLCSACRDRGYHKHTARALRNARLINAYVEKRNGTKRRDTSVTTAEVAARAGMQHREVGAALAAYRAIIIPYEKRTALVSSHFGTADRRDHSDPTQWAHDQIVYLRSERTRLERMAAVWEAKRAIDFRAAPTVEATHPLDMPITHMEVAVDQMAKAITSVELTTQRVEQKKRELAQLNSQLPDA